MATGGCWTRAWPIRASRCEALSLLASIDGSGAEGERETRGKGFRATRDIVGAVDVVGDDFGVLAPKYSVQLTIISIQRELEHGRRCVLQGPTYLTRFAEIARDCYDGGTAATDNGNYWK